MDKILVVEDEPALVDTLDYALSRQGYKVVIARDGLLCWTWHANRTRI